MKTERLQLRLTPGTQKTLKRAARRTRRSMADVIDILVTEHAREYIQRFAVGQRNT